MSRNLCLNKNCFRTGFCYLFKMCFQLLTHKNFIWVLDVQSFYDICSNGKKSRLRQGLRSMTRLCSKVGWKWSEKHRKSEISLIWCISTTNNAMWNHAKNSMKQLKRPTSLISHWFSVEEVQNGRKQCKRERFSLFQKFSEVSRVCHMKADVIAAQSWVKYEDIFGKVA